MNNYHAFERFLTDLTNSHPPRVNVSRATESFCLEVVEAERIA